MDVLDRAEIVLAAGEAELAKVQELLDPAPNLLKIVRHRIRMGHWPTWERWPDWDGPMWACMHCGGHPY